MLGREGVRVYHSWCRCVAENELAGEECIERCGECVCVRLGVGNMVSVNGVIDVGLAVGGGLSCDRIWCSDGCKIRCENGVQ